jgi:hypothetical protein
MEEDKKLEQNLDKSNEKLHISDVSDLLLLEKLKKIDKIARRIGGYYCGFGLPLDNDKRILKHINEIKKMIKVLKQ